MKRAITTAIITEAGENPNKKFIKLSKIKITQEFRDTLPRTSKLQEKYGFYKKYHVFMEEIVIDKHNELIDGYTTYLLCRMLDIKKIEVLKCSK